MVLLIIRSVRPLHPFRQIHPKKEYMIIRSIHQLLANNYSLKEALEILQWDKALQPFIKQITHSLKNGQNFSRTCQSIGFSFNTTSLLSLSMENGDLFQSITLCRKLLENRLNFTKKLASVSKYPLFLTIFFTFLLILIKLIVLPHYTTLIQTEIPYLQNAYFIMDSIIYFIIGMFFFSFLWIMLRKYFNLQISPQTRASFIHFVPIYRKYKTLETTLFLCSHLLSLMHTNLSLKECMQLLKMEENSSIYSYYARRIEAHLASGYSFSSVLPTCKLLTEQLQWILQDNKNHAQVMKDLEMYTDNLLHDIHVFLESTLKWFQPIVLSIIAIFIGIIYLSMMLPLYDYIQYL